MSDGSRESLEIRLQRACRGARGRVAIAARCLDDGATFLHHAERPLPIASVVKWPLFVLLHEAAARGEVDLERATPVGADEAPGGTGLLQAMRPRALTLRDAAFLMIAVSDNVGANRVIDALGGVPEAHQALQARFGEGLGLRGRATFDAAGGARSMGTATASALLRFLVCLAEGAAGGAREAVEVGRATLDRSMLARPFPHPGLEPGGVRVAHKSGRLPRVRADAGLLQRDGRTVAVAILSDGMAGDGFAYDDPAERWIAARAREIAEAWLGPANAD